MNQKIVALMMLLAIGAWTPSARAHGPDHAVLKGQNSIVTRTLIDDTGGQLTLIWITVVTFNGPQYTLWLKRDPNSADSKKLISLMTLGLQGRLWPVKITQSPASVTYYDASGNLLKGADGSPQLTPKIPQAADKTLTPNDAGYGAPSENCVQFLKIADGVDSVTIHVKSGRPIHGKINQLMLSNHDTVPPPPEPGGDEGDQGDEEMEDGEQKKSGATSGKAAPPQKKRS